MYGILHMKLSLCYTVWPRDVRLVEMYCCVFLMPAGDLPMTFAALIYADALPAAAQRHGLLNDEEAHVADASAQEAQPSLRA